jgi:PKD repeat protein
LPGSEEELIGQTTISSLSINAPENGSRYVYATWKNPGESIYLIEVEIDPSFLEENMLNNAATRAIIVGQPTSNQGAISGQVTNAWGGAGNVIVSVFDGGLLIGDTFTDDTGFYLLENIPVGNMEVRIDTPGGYEADAEAKSADVVNQSVTEVDFILTQQVNEPPVANPGGPYSGTVGTSINLDGSGSTDPEGSIVAYDWDFGDSSTGTGATPSHTYAAAGTYTVTLTVTDGAGATDTASITADVSEPQQQTIFDLRARAKSGKIDLVWTPVTGAQSYNVSRSRTQGGPYTSLATGHVCDYCAYADFGLTNGVTYYYVVTSVTGGAESLSSNEASATPRARSR